MTTNETPTPTTRRETFGEERNRKEAADLAARRERLERRRAQAAAAAAANPPPPPSRYEMLERITRAQESQQRCVDRLRSLTAQVEPTRARLAQLERVAACFGGPTLEAELEATRARLALWTSAGGELTDWQRRLERARAEVSAATEAFEGAFPLGELDTAYARFLGRPVESLTFAERVASYDEATGVLTRGDGTRVQIWATSTP